MTEQEYEMVVSEAALTELYNYTSGSTLYEEDHFMKGFLAGIKWARENPAPEVQAIIEAATKLVPIDANLMEGSFQHALSVALARFKERTAEKGEG